MSRQNVFRCDIQCGNCPFNICLNTVNFKSGTVFIEVSNRGITDRNLKGKIRAFDIGFAFYKIIFRYFKVTL